MDLDMDMDMDNSSSSIMTLTPLNDSGVDFSNYTQAYNFQQEILADTMLQFIGNQYATAFWYGVIVVIGTATMANVIQKLLLRLRFRAAAANRSRPASARSAFTKIFGGATAVCREMTYPQFSPARTYPWFKIPPVGIILLLLCYLIFILALEFKDNSIDGAQHYQSLGIRAGWVAVSQIPLLLLLAGKANLIGALVGVSYERLNVFHRWVSRGILLCVTLHFGYQSYGWNLYGLMQLEWATDTCPRTGIAAYALLMWINLTSLAPIRYRFYEFFVIQHILSFIAFIYLIMAHLPTTALYTRTYVYIGVGIFLLDRLIRTIRYAYNNIRPSRASLIALDGGVTKVHIQTKQIKSWTAGSHVFLSIPHLGLGQSHPATIASTPSSHNGDLVFILKRRKGFTNRILKLASTSQISLVPNPKQDFEASSPTGPEKTYVALVGGPYGACHTDPAAFDTVLFISGSTGVTFMLSNLLSLAHRAQSAKRLPLRRVDFVWIVKQTSWTTWIADELTAAVRDLKKKGIDVNVTIYVTRDEALAALLAANATGGGCTCQSSCSCCPSPVSDGSSTTASEKEPDARVEVIESFSATEREAGVKTKTTATVTSTAMTAISSPTAARRAAIADKQRLPFAAFMRGRPDIPDLVWELANQAEGEMGVFVCGPLGLCMDVRRLVAKVSDERAVHKGTGAEGIYLHVESFTW